MQVRAIEEHDVAETLDAVDRLYSVRVEAEARTFELAAHFADLHAGDSLPARGWALPGMERAVRLGGEGTPEVGEFAVAELGGRLRMGTWGVRHYVADALDVRHRLPHAWARVRSREARISNVRLVAARTRHLTVEAAAFVDRAMADHLDGSLPWGRFEARLDGRVVAADPALAAEREAQRTRDQFAKRTRSAEDGTAGFYVRSTVGVIARIEATVGYVADALKAFGDGDDVDQRRVKAVVLLCNPSRAVELLAAFAALRSHGSVGDRAADPAVGSSADEPMDHHAPDPLVRMDAFARRVGFTPTHLPAWLERSGAAAPSNSADPPTDDGRATADEGTAHQAAPATFCFDWSALLPPVTLNVHVSAETLAGPQSSDPYRPGRAPGQVARWEGVGPVTHAFIREHVSPFHRYVIQPVIDPAGMAPVDAYEVPDRHRRAVHLRTPADCFPYSSNLSLGVDVDHTRPHEGGRRSARSPAGTGTGDTQGGRGAVGEQPASRMDNYGPLGRFHHRIKTHGHWVVRQPFAGIYLWRDPHGQIYLVDHTGTTKVTAPGAAAGAAADFDPDVELHPSAVVIEVDFRLPVARNG